MNQTMSSPRSDWARYYQQNLSAASNGPLNTTMGINTSINKSGSGMIQEGRISKPIRKRSRVSRRTPTTLLSTTTTNFRAMVQQFTGDHVTPFSSVAPYPSGTNINLGITNSQPIANTNTLIVARADYNLAPLQQLQQFRHQQCMLPVNSSDSVGGKHAFLPELQSSRGPVMVASHGGFGSMEGACPPVPPSFSNDMSQFSYM